MKTSQRIGVIFLSAVCVAVVFFIVLRIAAMSQKGGHTSSYHYVKNDTYQGPHLTTAPWDIELYQSFFKRASSSNVRVEERIKGAILPHHLLAGHLDAVVFDVLARQKPSTVVLFSPEHFSRGSQTVTTASEYWKTPYGEVSVDQQLVQRLAELPFVSAEPEVLSEEHGIYGLLPFVAATLPFRNVVPLALRSDVSDEELTILKDTLLDIVPGDTVFLASVDFSHYQTAPVANFHDERTIDVIRSFDMDRIDSLEIDSPASVKLLLSLMHAYDTERIVHEEHTNAAELVGNPDATDITSYYVPLFAEGEREASRAASMLFVGDMMLDRAVATAMGTQGLSAVLDTLAGGEGRFFDGIDIVSGNLEGPFVEHRIDTTKEIAFRFDPKLAPQLLDYHFTHLTLANNHLYDMGTAGMRETERVLDDVGIAYYGDPYTVSSSSVHYTEVDGMTIAFVGLNDTFNSLNESVAIDLIQEAEKQADFTVLNIHWGLEYKPTSHPRQQYLAHTFIDAGVDLVIGHHPHVVQEMEVYNDVPIFYSLGNFLFDQYFSRPTQETLAVGTVVTDEEMSLYLFPLVGERSVLRQMNVEEREMFFANFFDRSSLGAYTFDAESQRFVIPL